MIIVFLMEVKKKLPVKGKTCSYMTIYSFVSNGPHFYCIHTCSVDLHDIHCNNIYSKGLFKQTLSHQ